MKKITILLILAALSCYAANTATTTTINNDKVDMGEDSFGNVLYQQSITMETKNFKVDNFWDRFRPGNNETTTYPIVSKTATVEMVVESTSICKLYPGMDADGCSGQKPFVINNEALVKDGVGLGNEDEITLFFQKAYGNTPDDSSDRILYNSSESNVFYPLDVERVEKYYKDVPSAPATSHKSFFARMFDAFFGGGFFGSFFNQNVESPAAPADSNVTDVRQRYIANIVSGIDKEHLLESDVTVLKTNVINSPVSLLDYKDVSTTSTDGSCTFFIFKLNPDGGLCDRLGGMPFLSMFLRVKPAAEIVIETDRIESDTESSLITFASQYLDKDIEDYKVNVEANADAIDNGTVSAIEKQEHVFFFFKWFTFKQEKKDIVKTSDNHYSFSNDEAVTLTFAVTDAGNKIDRFQTFKLLGIHSIAGNDHSCMLKDNGGWFSSDTRFTVTPDGINACKDGGWFRRGGCDAVSTIEGENASWWLNWCDNNHNNGDSEYFSHGLFSGNRIYYVDDSYTELSIRSLALDLKLITLDKDDKANTVRFNRIINIK